MSHMIKKYNVIAERGRKYRKIIKEVHYLQCHFKQLELKWSTWLGTKSVIKNAGN